MRKIVWCELGLRFALRVLCVSLLSMLVTNISLIQNITTQTTHTVTFAYVLLPKANDKIMCIGRWSILLEVSPRGMGPIVSAVQ